MYELIYTSAPRGLLQGRSGFCTVAMTTGFPPNLIPIVENMSGYRCVEHVDAGNSPVNCVCQQLLSGSNPLYAVSRIEYAGLSYTGRSNILAHHYLFSQREWSMLPCAPVDLLRSVENFPPWSGDPRFLTEKRLPQPAPPLAEKTAENWEKWTGSAEWAAVAAALFRKRPQSFLALGFPAQISWQELLALVAEICIYLSPTERRNFTFSTYCYQNQIGNSLFLRCYPEDSVQLAGLRQLRQQPVVMLGRENPVPPELRALLTSETPPLSLLQQTADSALAQSDAVSKTIPLSFASHPEKTELPLSEKASVAPAPEMESESVAEPAPEPPEKTILIRILVLAVLVLAVAVIVLLALFLRGKKEAAPPVVQEVVPVENTPCWEAAEPPPAAAARTAEPAKPVVPPPAKSSEKKPMSAAVAPSQGELLDFYAALHAGKTEIALPAAWESSGILAVTLCGVKGADVPPDRLKDFVAGNSTGSVRLRTVQIRENPDWTTTPVPANGAWMTLKLLEKKLLVAHDGDPKENLRNLKTIRFGKNAPFVNSVSDSWFALATRRYRISGMQLSERGSLDVSLKYEGKEPLPEAVREHLELVLLVDSRRVFTADVKSGTMDIAEMKRFLEKIDPLKQAFEKQKDLKDRIKAPQRPSFESMRAKLQQTKEAELETLKKELDSCEKRIAACRKQMNSKKRKERGEAEEKLPALQEEQMQKQKEIPACEKQLEKLEKGKFFKMLKDVLPPGSRKAWNSGQPWPPEPFRKMLEKLPAAPPYPEFRQMLEAAEKEFKADMKEQKKQQEEFAWRRKSYENARADVLKGKILQEQDFPESGFSAEELRQKVLDWYRKHVSAVVRVKEGSRK